MRLAFVNGSANQQAWCQRVVSESRIDWSKVPITVTVEWMSDPDPQRRHRDFAYTWFPDPSNTANVKIDIRSDLGDLNRDYALFSEVFHHELGHAYMGQVVDVAGKIAPLLYKGSEQGTPVKWGAGDPNVVWGDNIIEGAAETFKDFFASTRKWNDRAFWSLPERNRQAWLDALQVGTSVADFLRTGLWPPLALDHLDENTGWVFFPPGDPRCPPWETSGAWQSPYWQWQAASAKLPADVPDAATLFMDTQPLVSIDTSGSPDQTTSGAWFAYFLEAPVGHAPPAALPEFVWAGSTPAPQYPYDPTSGPEIFYLLEQQGFVPPYVPGYGHYWMQPEFAQSWYWTADPTKDRYVYLRIVRQMSGGVTSGGPVHPDDFMQVTLTRQPTLEVFKTGVQTLYKPNAPYPYTAPDLSLSLASQGARDSHRKMVGAQTGAELHLGPGTFTVG